MIEVSVPAESTNKKKSYHHGDLRNAIIHEAVSRARATGEKAIVLREIAPVIGVSATAAYRHFTNRQQLVEEVAARGFVAVTEHITLPPVGGAAADPGLAAYVDLRNALTRMVGFAVAEPAWARLMFENLGRSGTVMASAVDTGAVLQAIVDRGIEAGMFKLATRVRDERIMWAGVDGLCANAMFGLDPMGTPEADHATARTIDLCITDMLTEDGVRTRDAVALPNGVVTELPA